MINEECAALWDNMRKKRPLVHCITNYVTANTVANGLLAAGASPVMADSPLDAADITKLADSVLFNMGTFGKDRCHAMLISGQEAGVTKKPVVLDPVGAGSTAYRLKNALYMLRQFRFAVLRGNASEIAALTNAPSISQRGEKGVDSVYVGLEGAKALAKAASEKFSCAVTVTGSTDVVCKKGRIALVQNGVDMLSRVTGTGCLASGLTAALCAAGEDHFIAAVTALAAMGIAGENAAKTAGGTGSFYVGLLDSLTVMDGDALSRYARIEEIPAE